MSRLFVGFLVCFSVFNAFAQTETEKLDELKQKLSSLEQNIDNQSKDALVKKVQELKNVEQERDSLEIILEVYRAKLALTKSKLNRCSGVDNLNENDKANSFSKLNINEHGTSNSDLKKGYYVVLSSERTQEAIKRQRAKVQKSHPNLSLIIAQNLRKSWYHLCLEQPYTIETVQKQVNQSKQDGFKDAWFILLD